MKKKLAFPLSVKFSLVILLMTVSIGALIVFLSYQIYSQQIIDRYASGSKVLSATVSDIVDWDKIDHYIETGSEDEAYQKTLEDMRLCAQAGGATYVYVIKPVNDRCVFVYDTDSSDERYSLGTAVSWEDEFGIYAEEAKQEQEVGPAFFNENYGRLLSIYTPTYTSSGAFSGYLGIDYNIDALTQEQQNFIAQLAVSALIVSLIMTALFMILLRYLVIRPINTIAGAANAYLSDTSQLVSESNSITKLSINTHDELQSLSASLKKMEQTIKEYLKNLETTNRKAETDSMTSLLNREAFERRAGWLLDNGSFNGYFIFMMIDLDHFKEINDTWGHTRGDETIVACTQAIKSKFRANDLIGRMGGDEVAVFYQSPASLDSVSKRAEAICQAIREMPLSDHFKITVSIGIAVASGKTKVSYQELYVQADNALYDVKTAGRNGFSVQVLN